MNPSEKNNEKWLDDVLTNALGSDGAQPDFKQWRKGHPEAIETLKSRADKESSVSQRPQNVWRIIMKSKITKFATVAVIIIGVCLGLYFIGGPDMAGVAWAEVVENVEQIQTYMFRGKSSTMGGPLGDASQEMEMVMYWSLAHGIRMDTYMDGKITANMYILPAEKMMIQLMPEQKRYMRMLLTDELLEKMEEEQNNPRYMVKQFMTHEYTELGRDIIEGIEVEGIEVTDPKVWGGMLEKAVGRLWVDVETNLPVQIEMEMAMEDMETKMVMDQFEWGVELDPGLFEAVIPQDYELMAEVEMPDAGGEKAVDGLRLFAEMTGGSYPSDMGMMTAMKEISEAMREELGTEPNSMPSRETMEKLMKMQMVCMFYAQLVQEDKDPAYYGDVVTAEFGHAVLMRWKTGDDEYRVIFGDLTIEDVTAEELAELESLPLNMNPYAIKPTPADGAVAGAIDQLQLSWMPGAYVTEHEVYFGIEPDNLSLVGEMASPSYTELPPLERDTTYYWRIDEVQPDSSVAIGDVWSFSTGTFVGWWKLDETTGLTANDSSVNDNHGTLNNMPGDEWTDGAIDGALEFDGINDYVDCGNDGLNITDEITLSAWVWHDAFIPDQAERYVTVRSEIAVIRKTGDGRLHFYIKTDGTLRHLWSDVLTERQWHHVAGTWDGITQRLYFEGVEIDSRAPGGVLDGTVSGVDLSSSTEPLNGVLDDIRIYNRALSVEEVAGIYESATAISGE